MVELAKGPLGQLVFVWLSVMGYFAARIYGLIQDEPLGLAFMFAAAIVIMRLTPMACESFRTYWYQRRKN
ncbi:hypothetical protein pEaSNUABM5_00278 [Erwinia phage pEa_SNUABM_5]|uniref:Uncharacterized protein n=1 Tax=Erwinia phage pEa_SNUABM_5 TaxID=2797313 RepID=A0A7T8IVS2_9CAUD|nr:hypothetical protein MPK73_gp278 [Erwinia phage pEa_SNUABM_5]QQO90420.1 hypothetical protein pEaSNUABM5_00278 [Erwinia phage pEa_SNUABM_5]